ncbi:MAG: hypothetical protein AAAB35_11700 [Phyllobacterium sp.]|uniref:hypothetical protein n=1 Tax=Phyllobacterium sp. TaxID=1871046 RepID=UPI0030F0FA36
MSDEDDEKKRMTAIKEQMQEAGFADALRSRYVPASNDRRFNDLLKRLDQAEKSRSR